MLVRSQGVGILPVVAAAGATALVAGGYYGGKAVEQSYQQGWLDNLLQVIGLKEPPKLPSMRSPASQPPPAPQTAPKMRTWGTDDVAEAYAQQQKQFERDVAAIMQDAAATGGNAPADRKTDHTWLYVALGVAAVAGIVVVKRVL